jgi:hypothetical protein
VRSTREDLRRREGLGCHHRSAVQDGGRVGLPYGDYDMVALNSANKTVAVSGEGDSSQITGDIWVNRQT